jgi:hypothetical protein
MQTQTYRPFARFHCPRTRSHRRSKAPVKTKHNTGQSVCGRLGNYRDSPCSIWPSIVIASCDLVTDESRGCNGNGAIRNGHPCCKQNQNRFSLRLRRAREAWVVVHGISAKRSGLRTTLTRDASKSTPYLDASICANRAGWVIHRFGSHGLMDPFHAPHGHPDLQKTGNLRAVQLLLGLAKKCTQHCSVTWSWKTP